MGERTGKNESWHLEKETKGYWQKEKEERILGLLSHFFWLCEKVFFCREELNGNIETNQK
jgi:hypothetical protein